MDDLCTPADERREKDYRRLRTRNPICLSCGYTNHSAAMELAHIAPKRFHDDGGVLCSNCHREMSDTEKDYSYKPVSQNPMMETIGRYLLALSDWMLRIAETIAEFGRWLLLQADHTLAYEPEGGQ